MTKEFTLDRESLLVSLRAVEPGLTKREILEQSSCFTFAAGKVMTYNDEIYCRAKSPFGDGFEGAVKAKPLLDILAKMPDPKVKIFRENGRLIVSGVNKRARIKTQNDVLLPVDKIELPEKWKVLPQEFIQAASLVRECVSTDESVEMLTCVHLHPERLEASDNHHMIRYRMKTGFSEPVLVRGDSLKHVVDLEMTHFAESRSWMFFHNKHLGFTLAVRRKLIDYRDISKMLVVKGDRMTLPEGIADAAERAEVCSKEEKDENYLTVKLADDVIRIKGEGPSADFKEARRLVYKGPPVEFLLSPRLLIGLAKSYNEATVSPTKLKITGENFDYIVSLSPIGGKDD